jgi:hypothetical protein
LGVEWPPGSAIRYAREIATLFVKNTPRSLQRISQLLVPGMAPFQNEVELHFVEFALREVERLVRTDPLDADALRDLWRRGKGRLLYAPKIVTQSGMEATVKGVTEYVYPTSLSGTPTVLGGTTGVVEMGAAIVVPEHFEVREVGGILSVLPEVSPEGGIINLTMTPEIVDEPDWKEYVVEFGGRRGPLQATLDQPFFHTLSTSTTCAVKNGGTVLLSGAPNPRDNSKVIYTFVTARLIDPSGRPVKQRAWSEILKGGER